MKDFDTEFVFEDEKNKERKSLDSPSKILSHAIVNDEIEFVDDVNDKYLSVEKKKSSKKITLDKICEIYMDSKRMQIWYLLENPLKSKKYAYKSTVVLSLL